VKDSARQDGAAVNGTDGRGRGRRGARPSVVAVLAAASAMALALPAAAHAAPTAGTGTGGHTVTLRRGGHDGTVPFRTRRSGEAVVSLSSSAPGVSWQTKGSESAVVSAYVDGRYVTDIVIPSDRPIERSFAIGHVTAGRHTLRLGFAAGRSPAGAVSARVGDVSVSVAQDGGLDALVLRHAPVLYGRNIPALGDRFQSSTTDTPLLEYHEVLPAQTPGHRILQYTVIWSNEDGGTDSPALMARWGRTTDIEWAYRVEVDEHGDRVPGTGVYQAANHQTLQFAGAYEGDRPLMETCTSNNNLCDTVDDPMRFSLSPLEALPDGQPREHVMDTNPWSYPVMAQEMLREGKIESPSDPATAALGDQRSYLFVAVAHTASPAGQTGNVGLTIGVRLNSGGTLYRSDHSIPTSSVNRDGTAATTVELPPGTTASDIAEIDALRTPVTETGAALTVTRVTRAFFLGQDYLPQPSFVDWTGSVTLTPQAPTAPLWKPAN
jgi:hypothetical protein